MAKGPRGTRQRDAHRIARSGLSHVSPEFDLDLPVLQPPRLAINDHVPPAVRSTLLEVEDRRLWSPDRRSAVVPPVRSTRRWNVPVTLNKVSRTKWDRYFPIGNKTSVINPVKRAIHANSRLGSLSFKSPKFALVCVRRHARKEVLHALGKVGKGSGKPRKRNANSNIRCK